MAAVATKSGVFSRLWMGMRKWYFSAAGYNQLGLMSDDLVRESLPEVKEAVRRLPPDVYDDRQFRIKRALDLSLKHRVLPQDQWTKFEDDKPYLNELVQQVLEEWKEKREWDSH
ncbi:cytochrome b-c1 complex subunit 7-like [Saccoglossus kowalevskii]|uniref:Cytochrome b-c1 complex subunit 7 n=1 Tax=Saccoglossus kowalevskii TaxID=10224 RepID=A0ABM0GL51_SACKO|nr:PREDICTED: cytochrome b-c1 complex subunit 7-like [Saccoglossus kowalevskii]